MNPGTRELNPNHLKSVGPLIKALTEINPDLTAQQVIQIVHRAKKLNEWGQEVIDAELARRLATAEARRP